MEATTRDWRKLLNQELHYDYSSENTITGVWRVARTEEKINAYRVLAEGYIALGRP
jgi:hypothetical protein